MLVFGSCNVRAPLFKAAKKWPRHPNTDWSAISTNFSIDGPYFFTFTVGEMLQAIACYKGERRIPTELLELCQMSPRWAPSPINSPLQSANVALAEPTTSIEIRFDGYHLNRGAVRHLLDPLVNSNPQAKRLRSHWYNKGIVAMDDEAKREIANRLIALVPADIPQREISIEVLKGAVGRHQDVIEGLQLLTRELDMPLGIVAYTWRFMPDGRPLSWPDGFHAEVIAAASQLNLPLYEPRNLIDRLGFNYALRADLTHYTIDFEADVAKELINFGASISA